MSLDLLGLFQSPPRLRVATDEQCQAPVPVTARLRYPLRNHLFLVVLTCLMVCLAVATLQASFLGVAALIACQALYWRGLSLSYGPDAFELCWRLHKLARICWSQLFFVGMTGRGRLVLCEKEQVMVTVDPKLEEFDALCAVILRRAPAEIHISPAAGELLIATARLQDEELLSLYGPHFLAEPAVHARLWDPGTDPYESWQWVATTLAGRFLKARNSCGSFVIAWGQLGKVQLTAGAEIPKGSRAWARGSVRGGILNVEVDYQENGVRIYQFPAQPA